MEKHNADSFSIACTTCQSQLRVRDRSAVGQILTCPKCGSMVLVEPPETAGDSDRRRSPPPLPTPGSEEGAEASPNSQTGATSLSDTVDDPTLYGTVDPPPEDAAPPDEIPEDLSDVDADSGQPLLPTEEWTSASTLQWRSWLLIAVASVIGVSLAIAMFAWIVSGNRSKPPPRVATVPEDETETPPDKQEPAQVTEPDVPETVAPQPEATVKNPPDATPPNADPANEPEEPGAPKPDPVEGDGSDPMEKPTDPDEDAPPGFVTPDAPEKTESMTPAESLRKTLRAFGVLLDDERLPDGDAAAAGDSADGFAGSDPVPRPPPRNVDVAARLSDRFQQIEFQKTPLAEFLRFVSDFSTILITLDPDILPWLGVSPATPISISQSDSTVAALLEEALTPFKLGYTTVDNQLLVTRNAPAEALRDATLNVSDLTEGNEDRLKELAALIVQMISPESWSATGGPGTIQPQAGALAFKQREVILFRVLELCEKLRVARGLPPQSKFPPALFRLDRRLEMAQPRLEKRLTVNFLHPTPFVSVLTSIAQETEIYLLVDWQAAGRIGWNQDSVVTLSASDQSAGEVLNRLLKPMELTTRVVAEDVLQITVLSALEAHIDLEFYPLADILSEEMPYERLEPRIRGQLGEKTFRDHGGSGALYFDSKSRHLIAALPQPKQAALAALLAELR